MRTKTMEKLEKNQDYMIGKYQKGKRIKVADFQIGENVSLLIPKGDRHHSDLKRLPCTIIDKSSGQIPTYKLLCEHGMLNRRHTASTLMSYPGVVKGKIQKRISLTEAVQLSNMNVVVFCSCKKACQTRQCRCFNAKRNCSSRCHKGKTSKCQNIDQRKKTPKHLPSLPRFGGKLKINENKFLFTNTCSLDTWMAILKCALIKFPNLERKLIKNLPTHQQALIPLIKVGKYDQAKWKVAKDNGISVEDGKIDFFSGEYELIIKNYVLPNMMHLQSSVCDSPHCPSQHEQHMKSEMPTMNFEAVENSDWITPQMFEESVKDWFITSEESPCCRPLTSATKDTKWTHWDQNKSTR